MFQMGEAAQRSEKKKKKNGGAERRTQACRPSEGLGRECEDHEDETEGGFLLENPERSGSEKV